MEWWQDLWLNEGFATYIGWYAMEHLHPEWEVWSQFVTDSYQVALNLDSLRGSHPIEVPVRDASEVDQVFDAISYQKGCSVIRMLSSYLGDKTFLQGVADYLKAHAYGNATTNDLWAALSKASDKNINSFMDPWIRKIGYPLVTIAEEPGQISLGQSRFLSTGDAKPEEDEVTWWVPLALKSGSKAASEHPAALTTKEDTVRDIDESFYKLNVDQTGFYRTNYPPERLVKFGASKDKLSVQDRIGLVGDAAALAISGHATSASVLSLCEGFQDETNYLVWAKILGDLATVRSVFSSNEKIAAGLKKLVLKLVTPTVKKLGWSKAEGEELLTTQLRSLVLRSAGGAGDEEIVAEAKKRFDAYIGEKSPISPDLRLTVFRLGVENGGKEAYEALKQDYITTTSIDGKETALQALGRVQTPELARDYLEFQFSEHVGIQDTHTGSKVLALNAKTRATLWDWFKANWSTIEGKLGGNPVVLNRYVKMALSEFADHAVEKDIEAFFKDKDTKGFDKALAQISDTVRSNADYKERDEKLLVEWLEAKGYA
jgi:aminopeptidase N